MEEWIDIHGLKGYQISSFGNIRNIKTGKILNPSKDSGGYLQIIIRKKRYSVHRLVWEMFNGSIPEGLDVNHIDEDKTNNRLDNLNLMTRKENCNWGTRNKRVSEHKINHPSRSDCVIKLNKKEEILHFYPSMHQASRETGVAEASISYCCSGKQKTAGGYIWKKAYKKEEAC